MTTPTDTLLDRALPHFGNDVTWVMPEATGGLLQFRNFRAVHPFRPAFLALQRMKVAVTPEWDNHVPDTIALTLPRQADWACGLLAQALRKLPVDGNLLMVAPNDLGGKRYAKLLGEHFETELAESKSHCRLVALKRPAQLPDVVNEWEAAFKPQQVPDTNLSSLPGTFSHGRVDAGSLLLAQHLPELKGRIADLGAGWGYLAQQMLRTEAAQVDLFEADHNALELARKNLGAFNTRARFFWHDVNGERVPSGYDAVVMNPPFHDVNDTHPDLGRGFIAASATALRKGGQLWMVANAHLPYEETLKETFGAFTAVTRTGGYKVISAVKQHD